MVDFCGRKPAQRAGIGQFFLNDVDDAIEDVTWIKEHGLRGGVLLPNVAPDVTWVKPLYDPVYDPLWATIEELELPVSLHSGTGSPNYGKYRVGPDDHDQRGAVLRHAAVRAPAPLGRVRAVPQAQVRDHRGLGGGVAAIVKQLDPTIAMVRKGEIGELKYTAENSLPRSATEYFQRQRAGSVRASPASPTSRSASRWAPTGSCGAATTRTTRAPVPYSREALRQVFNQVGEVELRDILAGNAAKLYDFDLDALAPLAEQYGPTVEELAQPLDALPDDANEALLRVTAPAGRTRRLTPPQCHRDTGVPASQVCEHSVLLTPVRRVWVRCR